ncbi:MAG: DUF192 domain-containing protein [Hyphomicrobiales bacterium]|nr:DUF192 domain-containing protein [Hyphomicrobiales bacterium]
MRRFLAILGVVLGQATAHGAPVLDHLTITTASGPHKFNVEVMRGTAQLERGLMFRRFMPKDHGMLFDFGTTAPVMMWMKNTYIPLDMVFIDKSGHVINVAANAQPMDLKIIPSAKPAYAALELNAGVAATIGLKPGDEVHDALFHNQ